MLIGTPGKKKIWKTEPTTELFSNQRLVRILHLCVYFQSSIYLLGPLVGMVCAEWWPSKGSLLYCLKSMIKLVLMYYTKI